MWSATQQTKMLVRFVAKRNSLPVMVDVLRITHYYEDWVAEPESSANDTFTTLVLDTDQCIQVKQTFKEVTDRISAVFSPPVQTGQGARNPG